MTSLVLSPDLREVALGLAPGLRTQALTSWIREAAEDRVRRPWLGLIGIGLAVLAVIHAGVGALLLPLALCAWWWSPSDRHWILALGLGLVGSAWAAVGIGLITSLPLAAVAVIWPGAALLLAGIAVAARRSNGAP